MLLTTHIFAELRSNLAIGRAEALSCAMLSVIEDRVRPDAAHPSFWAPFVVVGEGAAVDFAIFAWPSGNPCTGLTAVHESVREGVVGNAEVMPKPYERPDDVRS